MHREVERMDWRAVTAREVALIPRLIVVESGLPSPGQTSDICEYLGLIPNAQGSPVCFPRQ